MKINKYYKHINNRINILKQYFQVEKEFSLLEESCVPSYCHKKSILAWVAWWRLVKAAGLLKKFKPGINTILDFGAGSGEFFHFIRNHCEYNFIESNSILKSFIKNQIPLAQEVQLHDLQNSKYDVILALDSLEHNKDPEGIIVKLVSSLKPQGLIILSGPTENFIYKIGRRLAGFKGDYHQVRVHDLEETFKKYLTLKTIVSGPLFLPIFKISVWIKK